MLSPGLSPGRRRNGVPKNRRSIQQPPSAWRSTHDVPPGLGRTARCPAVLIGALRHSRLGARALPDSTAPRKMSGWIHPASPGSALATFSQRNLAEVVVSVISRAVSSGTVRSAAKVASGERRSWTGAVVTMISPSLKSDVTPYSRGHHGIERDATEDAGINVGDGEPEVVAAVGQRAGDGQRTWAGKARDVFSNGSGDGAEHDGLQAGHDQCANREIHRGCTSGNTSRVWVAAACPVLPKALTVPVVAEVAGRSKRTDSALRSGDAAPPIGAPIHSQAQGTIALIRVSDGSELEQRHCVSIMMLIVAG